MGNTQPPTGLKGSRLDTQYPSWGVHSVKLKFNHGSRSFNLKLDEWSALLNLRKRKDITIEAADKGGAVVVWRTDRYQQHALRLLSYNSLYCKVK